MQSFNFPFLYFYLRFFTYLHHQDISYSSYLISHFFSTKSSNQFHQPLGKIPSLSVLLCSPTMAMGALQATMPTLAAAAGLYFFDKLHPNKVPGERSITHVAGLRAEEIGMVKSNNSTKSPKLAPQFDGLNCFETFVG